MNTIKDIASSSAVAWGDIALKIDENFTEVEGKIPEVTPFENYFNSLPSNTSLDGTEEVLIKKAETFYKSTVSNIVSLAGGGQGSSNMKIFTKDFTLVVGVTGHSSILDYVGTVQELRLIVLNKMATAVYYDNLIIPCTITEFSSFFLMLFYWMPSDSPLDSPGVVKINFNFNMGQELWINVTQ